jgi:hypothetical protein
MARYEPNPRQQWAISCISSYFNVDEMVVREFLGVSIQKQDENYNDKQEDASTSSSFAWARCDGLPIEGRLAPGGR